MPVKIVTTGLPQVRVEDSGTPLTEGLSRASETLLNLGPQLARINSERERNQQEMGLRQQSMDNEQAYRTQQAQGENDYRKAMIGKEGERIGLERARSLLDANRLSQNRRDTNLWHNQDEQRRATSDIAQGNAPVPEGQQYASGLPGILGRISQGTIGSQPDFTKSPLLRLQEQHLGKLNAQTQDISGRGQNRLDVAGVNAGAKNQATQAHENTALTSLIEKEQDAAVKHALTQKQMAVAGQGGDIMSVSLTPEEEGGIRSATESRVRAIHGQPAGNGAQQPQGDPWANAIQSAFSK